MFGALVNSILEKSREKRILIVGDFALDLYFDIENNPAIELNSVETGQAIEIVRESRFELGAAANVAANILSLTHADVRAVGILGEGTFGTVLADMLDDLGVDTEGLIRSGNVKTAVYTKKIIDSREVSRFDLGSRQVPARDEEDRLLEVLKRKTDGCDVILVNQQIRDGYWSSGYFREQAAALLNHAAKRVPVLVDSRDFADTFEACMRKVNQSEAAVLLEKLGVEGLTEEWRWNPSLSRKAAAKLFEQWGSPLIITRGENGAIVASPEIETEDHCDSLEGIRVTGQVDTVGAGDSFLAGCALAYSVGMDIVSSARMGSLVAAVTVRKISRTGTADRRELQETAASADLKYRPEWEQPVTGYSAFGTDDPPDVEVLVKIRPRSYSYAIFDHDGTISTLRQGWEAVMRRHMLRAIAGEPAHCDIVKRKEILGEIDRFIEETTGVQTIIQMHGLVDMVRAYGIMGASEIRTAGDYKGDYVKSMRETVKLRLERLRSGSRSVEDFTLRGVVHFLRALKERNVLLYLASGTDADDTRYEAEMLGYADLFEEIRGSVDDVNNDPKALVLSEILERISPREHGKVVVFGDGPVEIREGVKRGCTTVGVLSDEIRRYGWNIEKRARLVSVGAEILIPDFTNSESLFRSLWGD